MLRARLLRRRLRDPMGLSSARHEHSECKRGVLHGSQHGTKNAGFEVAVP
jgi:hypothetical protein